MLGKADPSDTCLSGTALPHSSNVTHRLPLNGDLGQRMSLVSAWGDQLLL